MEQQEKSIKTQAIEEQPSCKRKRLSSIFFGALVILSAFFAGFGVRWFTIEPEIRSLITVKDMIDGKYYKEISDEAFYEAIFGAINSEVLDAYSGYMTVEKYAEVTSEGKGKRTGIGLVFVTQSETGEDQMLVTRVCGNSPAENAGLLAGDFVIGFGETEGELTRTAVFKDFSNFLDQKGEGEAFRLLILRGKEEKIVTLARSAYVENQVFYRTNSASYTFMSETPKSVGAPLACLSEDTAYIRLVQFTGSAAQEFKRAMAQFKQEGKQNLVLDLRGNGGGYMDVMQEIASYFCKSSKEKKPIVAIADYGERKEVFRASGNCYAQYFTENSRICVLADNQTASASECLIGCMYDYGAISYGDICLTETDGVAKTFGKGIMQTTYYVNILKKDALKLTTAQIRWPKSNICIHDRGVLASDGTKTTARTYEGEWEIENAIAVLGV